jgi:hypothetical protein
MDFHPGRSRLATLRVPVTVAGLVAALAVSASSAFAHLADWTGEDSYYCTLAADIDPGTQDTCNYDGDSSGGSTQTAHSYAFQSVKNETLTAAYICTGLHRPSSGRVEKECGWDFKRNCWDLWQHSSDPLDCHDLDNITHYAYLDNESNHSTVVGGHPLW